MKNAFVTMLTLQDRMNTRVHPQWIDQHYAWFRALWIECGELIDHYGYKWWKKQQPDMPQVQLEVVDIWHFGLSMRLDGRDVEVIADEMVKELEGFRPQGLGVIEATEALAGPVLSERRFPVRQFWELLLAVDMDGTQLFKQYVGKNVLNFFRQDHGYKEGTYIKQWHGREDNEHLSEILSGLVVDVGDFADEVYQALESRYSSLSPVG